MLTWLIPQISRRKFAAGGMSLTRSLRSLSPKLPRYSVFYCYERLSSSSGGADEPRPRDGVLLSEEKFERKLDDFQCEFKELGDNVAETGVQCTPTKLSNLVTSGFAQKTSETNDDSVQRTFSEYNRSIVRDNLLQHDLLGLSNKVTWSCKEVIDFVHRSRCLLDHQILQDTSNFSIIRATQIYDLVVMLEKLDVIYLMKFRALYRPAMQEFVEAVTFFNYCKSDVVLALEDVNRMMTALTVSDNPIQITMEDYILGLADLTGELMRLAIRLIEQGELYSSLKIHRTICIICKGISAITNDANIGKSKKELDLKLDEAEKNGLKVANACDSERERRNYSTR